MNRNAETSKALLANIVSRHCFYQHVHLSILFNKKPSIDKPGPGTENSQFGHCVTKKADANDDSMECARLSHVLAIARYKFAGKWARRRNKVCSQKPHKFASRLKWAHWGSGENEVLKYVNTSPYLLHIQFQTNQLWWKEREDTKTGSVWKWGVVSQWKALFMMHTRFWHVGARLKCRREMKDAHEMVKGWYI
jgi:hypothetical protein